MIEALSTSDFHLEGLRKHFADDIARQLREVDRIYQYALQKGIQHIFVPGDLSDTPQMRKSTEIALMHFLKKYDGLINTYYICGNHDRSDVENTSIDFLKQLADYKFFKTFRIYLQPAQDRIDGTLVNFCAWPCYETLTEKEGALNFAHVEYNGAIGDNGRKLKTKHEFQQHKRDFTISGHIHQYQFLKARRAVYNGNPYQKNFGESLPKGFIQFKATTENKEVKFKHRFIDGKPQFRLETIHIESPKDFNKLSSGNDVRYKLFVAPDVLIPSDLRLQYPNITGGIFNTETKKQTDEQFEALVTEHQKPNISPRKGLKNFLSSLGHSKKEIKFALDEVQSAMNALGLEQDS